MGLKVYGTKFFTNSLLTTILFLLTLSFCNPYISFDLKESADSLVNSYSALNRRYFQ